MQSASIIQRLIQAGLKKRLLSILVVLPLFLLAVYFGGLAYLLVLAAGGGLAIKEMHDMLSLRYQGLRLIGLDLLGGVYIIVPCIFLIYIRGVEGGLFLTLFLFCCIWSSDTLAYLGGIVFGGPKLAPSISPKKTESGMFCAVFGTSFLCYVSLYIIFGEADPWSSAAAIYIAWIAQMGDLLESWLKRHTGVKDSGTILPGHGGVLDRVDGLLLVCWSYIVLWRLFDIIDL